MKTLQFQSPGGRDLFAMFAPTHATNICNECGRPAKKEAFARDWCLECLGVVERELNAIERSASAQEQAVADELARLNRTQKREHRGTPHEL